MIYRYTWLLSWPLIISPCSRYADIIVHRLLAVVTGQDSTYKELLDKRRTQNTCNHINYRHRMAQYSQRASVGLHTHVSREVSSGHTHRAVCM